MSSSLDTRTESVWKLPLTILGSFVVMIPWPVLGIALTYNMFDQPDEAALLFGGVTVLFLLENMLFPPMLSEAVFWTIMWVVWCSALVLPPMLMSRRHPSRYAITMLLVIQAAFSFAQAAIGMLIILGRSY